LREVAPENPPVEVLRSTTQSLALRFGLLTSQIGLLSGLFLVLYGNVLAGLIRIWWTQEESSHGFLVLPICALILWVKRRDLKNVHINPARMPGILVMGASGLLLVLGEVGGLLILSQLSMHAMIAGLTLALLGVRFLTVLRFPLCYSLFMLPSLAAAVLSWNWQFQLATARMGVFFLQLLGIPAQLDQNHIILPSIILRVAESCSGARYLISILALALPLGYLALRRLHYRVALSVTAVIIGITANWMRVVLIGVWAHSGGAVVHGPFHILQALSTAWVAFAGLFLVTGALSRMESRRMASIPTENQRTAWVHSPSHALSFAWNCAWARAALLLLALASYLTFYFRGPVPLRQSFSNFPTVIGNWAESGEAYESPILQAEGADEELHRIYVGPGDQRLHLYVAYFERQQHEKEAVSYLMAPLHQNAQTLSLGKAHSAITVGWRSNVDIPYPEEVFFWYDINGRVVSDPLAAKAATIKDALTRGRTNGALVLIHPLGNSLQGTDHAMKDFILALLPVLRDYLP
jgi:EpsI family protein